jgi:hypothetical protein
LIFRIQREDICQTVFLVQRYKIIHWIVFEVSSEVQERKSTESRLEINVAETLLSYRCKTTHWKVTDNI